MKKVRFFLEHRALLLIGALIRLLPRRGMLALGVAAGDLIYYCIPVRKQMTLEHIRRAFPEKTEAEIRRIARYTYRNLAMNSLEHLCLSSLKKEELLKIVRFCNEDVLKRAFARGKGVILVGGHFGNWEYLGGAISAKGYSMSYVVAGIANPYIDETVNSHRRRMGIKILPKGMSLRGILKTLRANGAMAMLMDQDAGKNGIFVEFFGRPCSTPRGPALFALKTGAAMVFVSGIREKDGTITATFDEVEIDYEAENSEKTVSEIMQRCTSMLEAYVLRYPGQWLWLHRRWKTTPQMSIPESTE